MQIVGVDIGATWIKAALVNPAGEIVRDASAPTATADSDAIVAHTLALVDSLASGPLDAVGVAVAAFLSRDRERVEMSPNISWSDLALRKELAGQLGVPVVVENDANAAAVAEYRVGSAVGARSLVMFTLGTGVGGAVVLDGELVVGAAGMAGELGHIVVDPGGARCGCGLYGCLETIASGSAIVNQVRLVRGDEALSRVQVEDILRSDSLVRQAVLTPVVDGLARALGAVSAVVDPDWVVLGGGVIERTSDTLVNLLREHYRTLRRDRHLDNTPQIVSASLGNAAGLIGAALLAHDALRASPPRAR